MKKEAQLVWILTILFLFIFVVAATMEGPVRKRLSKIPILAIGINKIAKYMKPYHEAIRKLTKEFKIGKKGSDSKKRGKVSAVGEAEGERVAIFFKDGNKIEGVLLDETKDMYIVSWKGVDFDIYKSRVKKILRGKEALKTKRILTDAEIISSWPYKNSIVVRLTNRVVLDAKIKSVDKDKLILLYRAKGGGYIEQDIARAKVEYLIFKPVNNEKSAKIESTLKELLPEMEFYKSGGFTIVTDSYSDWVKKYEKALREAYTEIYLAFFDIFKDREPDAQNFVVIFDNVIDYFEYAAADGVPGWAVAGYFLPDKKVLYLYNVLGEKFSEILFDAFVGETGKKIDDIVDTISNQIDKRYHIFLEGQAMQIKSKFWEAYDYYKNIYREETMSVLRHEFTHEIFHNWGLQWIILSKMKDDDQGLFDKKKKMLQSDDPKEKARLLRELATWQSGPMDVQAANSWMAEGVATYCMTYPLGVNNNMMLYFYQEMDREGEIYPLESLTFHKIGSFPGVAPKAMLYSYAQSWAFVHFLMNKYPKEFMAYQEKMAGQKAEEHEDIQWLLDSIGISLQDLRSEFKEYMDAFDKVDDPLVANFAKMYDIFMD
ncbi:MAG: hypothetical protein ABH843_00830 [Candidatus Omnitrophota bacterium]